MVTVPNPQQRRFFEGVIDGAHTPAAKSFWKGMQWGAEGSLVGLPMIALEAGMAQRGEVVPTTLGRTAGLVSYPAMSALTAAALGLAFGSFTGVGLVAGILAMYPDQLLQDSLIRGIRTVTDAGRQIRHLETGGSYQDSLLARNQRMNAIREMSGAHQVSRRFLGQEALFFHR